MEEVDSVLEDKFPSRDIFVTLIICCSAIPLMALICHILKMFQCRPVKLQATNILLTEVIHDVVQFMAVEDMKRLKRTSRVLHVHISRRLQKIKIMKNLRVLNSVQFVMIVATVLILFASISVLTSRVLHAHISRRLQKIEISTENSKAAHPPIKVNPAKWTCEDVFQWFTDAGYPALAEKLLEQEYDGEGIMLLKRDNFISWNKEINLLTHFFGLKQGPALKVHALIEH